MKINQADFADWVSYLLSNLMEESDLLDEISPNSERLSADT